MNLSVHQASRKFNKADHLQTLIELAKQKAYAKSPEAVEIARQALRMAEDRNETQNLQFVLTLLAQDLIVVREIETARKYLNRAEPMAISAGDWKVQAWIHRMRNWMAHDSLESEKSLYHIRRSIELFAENGQFDMIGHRCLCRHYFQTGLYLEAIEIAHKIIHEYAKADNSICGEASSVWGIIAAVYIELDDAKGFSEANSMALHIAESLGDVESIALALESRACATTKGMIPGDANADFQLALKYYKQLKQTQYYVQCLLNFSYSLFEQGDRVKSRELLAKAIPLAKQGQLDKMLIFAHTCIGKYQNVEGNFAEALPALEEALELAQRGELLFRQLEIHEEIITAASGLGLSEKELLHSRELLRLKKLVHGQKVRSKIAAVHSHFEMQRTLINQEMLRLQNLKLHNQIEGLNQQLAKMATVLAQRNAALNKITQQATEQLGTKANGAPHDQLSQTVNSSLTTEPTWSEFEQLFASVNGDFIHSLTQQFPDLTPGELKVCTLLKLNLSSAQIAETLFLSAHTVNTHRQKIRRKLKLKKGMNLVTYLQKVTE